MLKKLIAIISLFAIVTPWYAAYEEIECSTDTVFSENSCNQCFDWGTKMQWDYLGLLSDLWMNVTDVAKILYKEEQVDPEMVNLDSDNVNWSMTPNNEKFWEYTADFNALYSDLDGWYVLDAGKSITWLQSSLSHAFNLEKNTAAEWQNIGLLVYPITTHNMLKSWDITVDSSEHKECILFKSWEAAKKVIVPPKKLPKTGPGEFLLLAILAMILGFGLLKFKTRS